MLVSLGLFLTNNPSTLAVHWDSLWGAGSFETITSLATKYNLAGYVASTTSGFWGDTFGIVAYIFWALTGYEGLAYVAGEVRNPRTSFLYAFMGGMVATVIWYAALTAAFYNTYGNFVLQYSYVYNLYTAGKLTANETSIVAPYMVAPSMPLFAGSLGGTPILDVLGAWWFWVISAQLATYLLATRSSFGMAFDRMFPAVFGDINDRTHTPIKGTLLNLVCCALCTMISFTFLGLLVSAANTSFWFALFYFIFAISAIMVPFKRKDLWAKGTAKKIFGIPDTTLLGALAAIGMLWIMALSTLGISSESWNITMLWMGIGVLIFVYYAMKLQKGGINIAELYGEIPPP
jgi:amino acid transporter